MVKIRIYFLQIIGIIMLLAGYLLSDRPDSESVMHFDLSSTHIISGAKHGGNDKVKLTNVNPESKGHHHKHRTVKTFSFSVILPKPIAVFCYIPILSTRHTTFFSQNYIFLYAKEINPPPPKVC